MSQTYPLKIRRIGNSLGVTLPKDALKMLGVGEGDKIVLTDAPEGFRVTPYDEAFEKTMEAFDEGRKRYRNALRELAK